MSLYMVGSLSDPYWSKSIFPKLRGRTSDEAIRVYFKYIDRVPSFYF